MKITDEPWFSGLMIARCKDRLANHESISDIIWTRETMKQWKKCLPCDGKGKITGSTGNDPGPSQTVECEICHGNGAIEVDEI